LAAISTSGTKYLLTWKPAADNIKVIGYQIFVEGVYVDLAQKTNYELIALEPDRTYHIQIRAIDGSGNVSPPSGKLIISTKQHNDFLGPTVNLLTDKPVTTNNSHVTVIIGTPCLINLSVYNEEKQLVKTFYTNRASVTGEVKFMWDGRDTVANIVPSGVYTLSLSAKGEGNVWKTVNRSVNLDFAPPTITEFQVSNSLTEESGSSTTISFKLSEYARSYLQIRNSKGETVHVLREGEFVSGGNQSVTWNGKDNYFQLLPDDKYTVFSYAIDRAGRRSLNFTVPLDIEFSNPSIGDITWSQESFKPGPKAVNRLTYHLSEKSLVSIKIYDVEGNLMRTLFEGERLAGVNAINWDGKDTGGQYFPVGTYMYKMNAVDLVGKTATEMSGVLTIVP
jgi:flagellar hook assembly protein FlgD